jgi:hypothetical protein
MPTIAGFYGIAIQMFYNDHSPPHLHARYGRAKAIVRLSDGAVQLSSACAIARAIGWPVAFSKKLNAGLGLISKQ